MSKVRAQTFGPSQVTATLEAPSALPPAGTASPINIHVWKRPVKTFVMKADLTRGNPSLCIISSLNYLSLKPSTPYPVCIYPIRPVRSHAFAPIVHTLSHSLHRPPLFPGRGTTARGRNPSRRTSSPARPLSTRPARCGSGPCSCTWSSRRRTCERTWRRRGGRGGRAGLQSTGCRSR